MRKSDKKKAIAKANLIAENQYLINKGLITENVFHADSVITEEVAPVRTKGRNFIYGEDHRRSAYITGDIAEKEASEIMVNSDRGKNYWQVVIIIGLMDFQSGKPMGSWLKYVYTTKTGESKLIFNNNYTKWENFYEVVDAKFHTPFRRMQEELDKMAIEMIKEKGGSAEINEAEPIEEAANQKFDLTNPEIASNLKRDIIDVLNKYLGISYTDDAGMSNDNRVVVFNELQNWVNTSFVPSSLRKGQNGNEIYTNNPKQMKQYLNKIGVSDYTLKGINGKSIDDSQGPSSLDEVEGDVKEEAPEQLVKLLMNDWATGYAVGQPGIGDFNDYDIKGECVSEYELILEYALGDIFTFIHTIVFEVTQTGSPRRASLESPEEFFEYEFDSVDVMNIEFRDENTGKTYVSNNRELYTLLVENADYIIETLDQKQEIVDCSNAGEY